MDSPDYTVTLKIWRSDDRMTEKTLTSVLYELLEDAPFGFEVENVTDADE